MKLICLNFQDIKETHLIYAWYILYLLQARYFTKNLVCLANPSVKPYFDQYKLVPVFYNKKEFNAYLSDKDIGADITWDGVSKVLVTKSKKDSKRILKPCKKERFIKRFRNSGKWLYYHDANTILENLFIKRRKDDFISDLPKDEAIKKSIRNLDKNKTILFLSMNEKNISLAKKVFFKQWIKKILETESVSIIFKSPFDVDINHTDFLWLNVTNTSFYDTIHLINAADVYAGCSEDNEQIATFLKKPIFLFIANEKLTFDDSCWVNYLKCCNIRDVDQLDNKDILKLADSAYLLFSDLIYDVNLNIKLSTQQLWGLHYLIQHPTAMLFFDADDHHQWEEKNYNFKEWIIPLLHEGKKDHMVLKKIKERLTNSAVTTVFCDRLTPSFKVKKWVLFQTRSNLRSIKWIKNSYYKFVPIENLVEGMQFLKETQVYGR